RFHLTDSREPAQISCGALAAANSFGSSRPARPSEFHILPGQPHLAAACVILSAIDAHLTAHRIALEAAIWTKYIGPMHIVGHLHPDELRADRRTTELLEFFAAKPSTPKTSHPTIAVSASTQVFITAVTAVVPRCPESVIFGFPARLRRKADPHCSNE